jgi:hypothetical protein
MKYGHPDTVPAKRPGGGVRGSDGTRTGSLLLEAGEGTVSCYRLSYGEGRGGAPINSPRHRHTFDQIRFIMSGEYEIADKVIPGGLVGYFPESVHYGPQVISSEVTILDVQFGGASGLGYLTPKQLAAGRESLLAEGKGTLENGLYVTVDANGKQHNQDAFEAVQQHIVGHRVDYAQPRYLDQVWMNPDSFEWVKDEHQPGVARKMLGEFTERDVRIGFFSLEEGAELTFGTERASEIAFINKGAISYDGKIHPRLTAFGTEAADNPEVLLATEPTELLYMKLPTF